MDFFLLQDLVTADYAGVRFFMPFDEFRTASVPEDDATYRDYRPRSIEFKGLEIVGPSDTRPLHADNARVGTPPV